MLKVLSFGVLILIALGLRWRHDRSRHIKFMGSAFTIDILMVLYIEWTRQAIHTATHPTHPFIVFHVLISVAVVLLYGVQIRTGYLALKGQSLSIWHKRAGWAFVGLRLSNFVTSLFVEQFKN